MRQPFPSEGYITVVDNKGREKVQRVEFVVRDVRGEEVYVQESGKVKGLSVVPPSEIEVWYIAPRVRRRQFGL